MIQIQLDNVNLADRRPGEAVTRCQLNIAFAITPLNLVGLREIIDQQSLKNPGVTFEVHTQERMRWQCNACARQQIAEFGDKPSGECVCLSPEAKWLPLEAQ